MRRVGAIVIVLAMTFFVALPTHAWQVDSTPGATPESGTPVAVDAGPAFVIHPEDGVDGDFFTVEVAPGTSAELTVVLGNADDTSLDLRTYVADAVPQPNGGFGVSQEETAPGGTATWIDYPAETFNFEASEGVERSFAVTVPEGTAPGQYIAGLVLQTAEPLAVEGSALFNQIIRKIVAVLIVVPGTQTPEFSVGPPDLVTDGRFPQITIPVTNSGNMLVKPQGTLSLTDSTGNEILRAPIAMGSVYAGTTAPLLISLRTPPPDGTYTVAVDLADTATGATAALTDGSVTIVTERAAVNDFVIAGSVLPSPDAAIYADIALTIDNTGAPVAASQVFLDIVKDGDLVETFTMASSLALPQGVTAVAQRYIPPTGWETGTWTFVVRLEVLDPMSGSATNVATFEDIPAIMIVG
jgi:hypothetical protein